MYICNVIMCVYLLAAIGPEVRGQRPERRHRQQQEDHRHQVVERPGQRPPGLGGKDEGPLGGVHLQGGSPFMTWPHS